MQDLSHDRSLTSKFFGSFSIDENECNSGDEGGDDEETRNHDERYQPTRPRRHDIWNPFPSKTQTKKFNKKTYKNNNNFALPPKWQAKVAIEKAKERKKQSDSTIPRKGLLEKAETMFQK